VGWRIAMNARIEFKLQVTAMPGFHSVYNWCFQPMWLFSGVLKDPEDDTVMEMHCTEAQYSAVKCLMDAIRTGDNDAQQDAAHQMIHNSKPWLIRRWSELTLANGKAHDQIMKENVHHVDFEWTEEEQAKLKILVEKYTSQGGSGASRVHSWWLAYFSVVLEDTENWNAISGQWYDEWPLDTWVDSPIFRWLRDTFLPMLLKEPAGYPEPDEHEASNDVLLHQPESNKCALSRSPPCH